MSTSRTGAALGRWIAIAAAALLVACGGGSTDPSAPPGQDPPAVQPPAPEPVKTGALDVLAGRPGGPGYLDGNGPDARFLLADNGIAVDAAGSLYLTDGNARIRSITPQGQVGTRASGVTNGRAIAVGKDGSFLVTDGPNNRILKISAAGAVTPYAGTGIEGSADGPAAAAQFLSPRGLALAADGTLYVSDYAATIRKISPDGVVSTLAGQARAYGDVDGKGAQARFQEPGALAVDAGGRVIVSDSRSVRAVDAAGNVTTLVRFASDDRAGSLAVRDGVIHVRSLASGAVLRISGSALVPVAGQAGPGYGDGPAAQARFGGLGGMAFDGAGNLYVVDGLNNAVRKLTPQGIVSTLAGAPALNDVNASVIKGVTNGPAATARFNSPDSLAQDRAGNLYVSDSWSHTVRKISGGTVSTFAGVPGENAGFPTYTSLTRLTSPSGLTSDGESGMYVVEAPRNTLRRIPSTGTLEAQIASGGIAPVCFPVCGGGRGSVVRDGSGGYYLGDETFNVIRRIDAARQASVFAGTGAGFSKPGGLARDAAGNLYVADSGNNTIRKITPAGAVSTFAGVAGLAGDADGPASTARFNFPAGLAIDTAGNLYVADRDNALLRKITPAGMVSTVAGQRGIRGVATGPLPASLNRPFGLLLGQQGELYVTDTAEHVILKITLP